MTTDSILKNGISTFDEESSSFSCGVYRSPLSEIVETEKFTLICYATSDKNKLGTKLYKGFEDRKRLVAICERDQLAAKTEYAYFSEDVSAVISNNERLLSALSEKYDPERKKSMRRLESFTVDHGGASLPTVKEAGISKCLTLWRMADSYHADTEKLHFFLYTGKTEYVFFVTPKDRNIYCGASYIQAFDLGIFISGQFFRIRNYKDNSEKFCGFHSDFSYEPKESAIPTEQCKIGKVFKNDRGLMFCVKRYNDDEIVLQGCGGDEYVYRREDKRTERFI